MKRYFIVLVAAAFIFTGCDLLNESPATSLTDSQVYSTEQGLESAMYGIYSSMYGSGGIMGQQNEFIGSTSLLIHWKNNRTSDRWASSLRMTLYSTSSDNLSYFSKFYSVIASCNRLLDGLAESPVDPAYKTEIDGEARFIRAVMYFHLVRLYGDVPLVLHYSTELDKIQAPRDKYTLVYKQIADDLEKAYSTMRSKTRQQQVTGTTGRVYNEAARAYLAAVYAQVGSILYDPDYQFFNNSLQERKPDFSAMGVTSEADAWNKVIEYSTAVINSGVYSLCDDYSRLFRWKTPEDFTLDERIFTIQSVSTASSTNIAAQYSLPSCPEGSSEYLAVNSNDGRYRPERFVYRNWSRTHGGVNETGRSDGLENIWSGCKDPRLNASYFHGYYNNIQTKKKVNVYPTVGTLTDKKTGEINHQNDGGFPYFKKYLDPLYDGTEANSDMYLMRFAEMYLLRAEAHASLSQAKNDEHWAAAYNDMEVLHKRARGENNPAAVQSSYPKWEADQFSTPAELIEGVFWERVYETHGEGGEFYETHRRGARFMSDVIAKPMSDFLKEKEQSGAFFEYFYLSTLPETDPNLLKRSVVLAYPEGELSRNGRARQNDYFWM